jgi:hypothetical protein
MATGAWLADDPKVRMRIDSEAHECAAEQFVSKLYARGHWKGKELPGTVRVIARVGHGSLHVVYVDIVTHPELVAYVGGLARRCNSKGEEI